MKNFILSFVLLFSVTSAFASSLQKLVLPGKRILTYQGNFNQSEGPVLIFLPGIYRGFHGTEKFLQLLKEQNVPYVHFHFAEHPDSIVHTNQKRPDFSTVMAKDLADEVSALVDELEIENPVPVTLSYSAVVTQHLDSEKFPVVFETAPIGLDTDGLPADVVTFYKSWEAWLSLFPFYGEFWIKQTKEYHLRNHWGKTVDEYKERLPQLKDSEYRERALQGYIALSRSSENFDFRKQDFKNGPKRFFILGQNEDEDRKRIQLEAIQKYTKVTGHKNNTFVLPDAGHVVPNDEPSAYVEALVNLLSQVK